MTVLRIYTAKCTRKVVYSNVLKQSKITYKYIPFDTVFTRAVS